MALETGQRVGDYEVISLLGAGGMGRVYSVRNVISDRVEAMKILLPDFASEPDLAARFMAEIRTLAGLEHPNIAQLRTAFQFGNELVMVMEFVEGTTLEKLAGQTRIPLDHVIEYSAQVLSALGYAHSRGVTHRDIKPANIMITSHGLVKLMDFGIAKSTNDMQLTRPGTTMGSVYYMSPEQVRGGTVDARSDIYSFGVTLYEMLTGRRPFQADTSYSVLNAQLNEAPTPPSQVNPELSPELNNIVLRAMVKHPDGRFQTAEEFRTALLNLRQPQQAQPQQPQQGFVPVAAAATPSAGKSHRGLWVGLGAVAAILALVAAATLLPHLFATHASQKAAIPVTDSSAASPAPATPAPASPASGDGSAAANPLTTATPSASPDATPATTSDIKPASGAPPAHLSGGTPRTGEARSKQPSQTGTGPAVTGPEAPAPAGPSPLEIKQARNHMIDLDARADAARTGVQQIRSQQQAQGLDIRGDILTAQNRMTSYMNEANRALGQNDLQAANEYMDRAETELSVLEKFLGR